jgi:hypothetical protein
MKLLFENWKRFLKEADDQEYDYDAEMAAEASELEQKHFGSIRELAKMAYDTYHQEMQRFVSKIYSKKELPLYHNAIAGEVYHKSGKALLDGGRGSFRATFIYGNDYVIKIDATLDGSGKDMNREDKELGTDPQYEDLFPRCYFWDSDYKWIVLEKVEEITNLNTLNQFFKSSLIRDNSIPEFNVFLIQAAVKYKVGTITKDQTLIDEAKEQFNNYKSGVVMNSYVTLDSLVKDLDSNKTFISVCNAVVRFNIEIPEVIKKYNSGVGADGRFVILDSSIKKTLEQGLKALA